VAAGYSHSLALSWDGRVFSWGGNGYGQLGQGDRLTRLAPALLDGLEGVLSIAAESVYSFAVAQSGVFSWGREVLNEDEKVLRPILVEGFGEGVRVRCVVAGVNVVFAIGEAGELLSWGCGGYCSLGHGKRVGQPSPKRVEALRDIRVSSVSLGGFHALALTEDGWVYSWVDNEQRSVLGNPNVASEMLPKPVEALRHVRVGYIAAATGRSYAVADTGELWAWGRNRDIIPPLGHGEKMNCPLPKPVESLRGVKMLAVHAGAYCTLALAEDWRVYAWGNEGSAIRGALGRGPAVRDAGMPVLTPQRVPLGL
jgi:alpha-tubulin suppressor-like RCC1 family protein